MKSKKPAWPIVTCMAVGVLCSARDSSQEVEAASRTAPSSLPARYSATIAAQAQVDWAKYHGTPPNVSNELGIELVLIPPGQFEMGSSEEERKRLIRDYDLEANIFDDEKPQHPVEITRAFYLAAHEVTVGQFRQFIEDTGYKTDAERNGGSWYVDPADGTDKGPDPQRTWRDPGFPQTDEHPVTCVSWNDAQKFCNWLSQQENASYRLPTEAEWEYACRSGTATTFYSGDDYETVTQVGNVADASFNAEFVWSGLGTDDGFIYTSPVGRFRGNSLGLFDMHGNVWEWCQDWYSETYYADSPRANPTGPSSGESRVFRGGAWDSQAGDARSAGSRASHAPVLRDIHTGFRVMRTIP